PPRANIINPSMSASIIGFMTVSPFVLVIPSGSGRCRARLRVFSGRRAESVPSWQALGTPTDCEYQDDGGERRCSAEQGVTMIGDSASRFTDQGFARTS